MFRQSIRPELKIWPKMLGLNQAEAKNFGKICSDYSHRQAKPTKKKEVILMAPGTTGIDRYLFK